MSSTAGVDLGRLARVGTLRRGLRAVLSHHVIFHWNRIGLSYGTQAILAHAVKTAVLDE
nr:lantibiotic dehydratase C-terminal domain-containing protein [Amycolatopsis thailandensis]